MHVYHIHDRGNRPFQVRVKGHTVSVYKADPISAKTQRYTYSTCVVARRPFVHLWVGADLGQGPKADGNTVLALVETQVVDAASGPAPASAPAQAPRRYQYQYIYVGPTIKTFTTLRPLHHYYSPLGPAGDPRPYAVDAYGRAYLLQLPSVSGTIRVPAADVRRYQDPYAAYLTLDATSAHRFRRDHGFPARVLAQGRIQFAPS